MSGPTLILGVSSVLLIQISYFDARKPQIEDRSTTASDFRFTLIVYTAKWAVSTSLSGTVIVQIGIALLSRSLDRKGSRTFSP